MRFEGQFVIVALVAGPAEPDAVAFPERGGQRDGKAALRRGLIGLGGGNAIGYDDETAQRIALQGLDSKTAQLIMPTSE